MHIIRIYSIRPLKKVKVKKHWIRNIKKNTFLKNFAENENDDFPFLKPHISKFIRYRCIFVPDIVIKHCILYV